MSPNDVMPQIMLVTTSGTTIIISIRKKTSPQKRITSKAFRANPRSTWPASRLRISFRSISRCTSGI